ncbi:MAG: metal ABC transporter substrate-binding protein [Polyangiaceae bacterium]
MSRWIAVLFGWLVLCVSWQASAAVVVVTSTADLASIAKEVGGANVEVTSLALHTQDPHFVDAKPHLAMKLAKADLLVIIGLDLEVGWLPTLQTGSRNGKIQAGADGFLDCSEFVKILEVPAVKVDRSQGDVHPQGNPHYMLDPRQAARVTKGIADRLAKLDAAHADAYRKNALNFIRKLGKATKGWEAQLAKAKGQKVVAYHKSIVYFADWLGLDVVEYIEPRPGIPPNPHHVTHVIEVAKGAGVKSVLQEAYYPSKNSELIAKQTGATLVKIPGAPDFKGGKSYIQHIDGVVRQLAKIYP